MSFYLSELLSCSSHFFLNDCRGLRTCQLAGFALGSWSLQPDQFDQEHWQGQVRPSDMHPFGYTPNALVPKALKEIGRPGPLPERASPGAAQRDRIEIWKKTLLYAKGLWRPAVRSGQPSWTYSGIFPDKQSFQSTERDVDELRYLLEVNRIATSSDGAH